MDDSVRPIDIMDAYWRIATEQKYSRIVSFIDLYVDLLKENNQISVQKFKESLTFLYDQEVIDLIPIPSDREFGSAMEKELSIPTKYNEHLSYVLSRED